MQQAARQLVDVVDGFALGKTHLIVDRDAKYCEVWGQAKDRIVLRLLSWIDSQYDINCVQQIPVSGKK
jgi:hypothetical protein